MRPLSLSDGVFDCNMIYFSVVFLALSLGVKVGIRASGDCKDCAVSWEGFGLLLVFLDLWQRWWDGFGFDLGVDIVLRWVGDFQNYWGICYLWSWWRVCYLWS
jgi:hypothetical protein